MVKWEVTNVSLYSKTALTFHIHISNQKHKLSFWWISSFWNHESNNTFLNDLSELIDWIHLSVHKLYTIWFVLSETFSGHIFLNKFYQSFWSLLSKPFWVDISEQVLSATLWESFFRKEIHLDGAIFALSFSLKRSWNYVIWMHA